jgi:hypothetical protein
MPPFRGQIQPIDPELATEMVRVAEGQPEFKPITAALARAPQFDGVGERRYNTVVLAFRPTDDQRRAIAEGEDIYVSLLTFLQPMWGIIVTAGKHDMGYIYNLEPTSRDPLPGLPGPTDPPTPPHPKPVG